MPVFYRHQAKAWMVGNIFEEYLLWFDKEVAKGNENRKVLLFMDNASVHTCVVADCAKQLRHTKVVFFPPNMTSRCQPLDAGIIQTLKLGYRQNLHTHVMRHINADIASDPIADVSIALTICWISRSWNKLNARTILAALLNAASLIPYVHRCQEQ